MKEIHDIVIIGGGAAGCMAAAAAWETDPQARVLLIERNLQIGKKVLISGGGRCNVTTGIWDKRLVADRYPRGWQFLQSAFYAFPPEAVMAWFESHGVPLKTEEDGRVFPISNTGEDIVEVFREILRQHPGSLKSASTVVSIEKSESQNEKIIVLQSGEKIWTKRVILACGGQAYRQTGSKGEAYAWAEHFGHTVTSLAPSLSAFLTEERWTHDLAGVAFKKVRLKTPRQSKWVFTGPILFTHKGLTGPAIFAFSSLSAFEEYDKHNPMPLRLDFLPDWSHEQFQTELEKELNQNPKKWFRNSLSNWIPKSMAAALCERMGVPEERLNHEISKKIRNQTLEELKNANFNVIGRAAGEEFVTAGGVDTQEVDSKTGESKRCEGLYFAGELLNIDGFTGGYNLQCAWATGYRAGASAAEASKRERGIA